jgi:translocator protein
MSAHAQVEAVTRRLADPGPRFHALWSLSYASQSVGAWLVWRSDAARGAYDVPGFAAYGSQLGLGVAWALLFFGLRRPALALVDVCVLWLAIAVTIAEFARRHRYAATLLVPYLGWATYAAAVNGAVWWRSRRS